MSFVSRRRGEECLSDLLLDVLIADDASPELSARARAHAGDCEACRSRWVELARNAEPGSAPTLSRPHAAPDQAREAPSPPSRRGRAVPLAWRWVGAVAAAACVLLVFQRLEQRDDAPTGERLKGSGRLGFFVQRSGEVSRGGPGELLHPGDAVQFTYFAPSAGYLVVLSRGAAGAVSVYHPSGAAAAPVVAGEQTLSTSTLLDDTLGEETIEAVFCTSQADVETVRAAREGAGAGPLEGCTVDALSVVKEAP